MASAPAGLPASDMSITFNSPDLFTSTLSGLMSRLMKPLSCRCWYAIAADSIIRRSRTCTEVRLLNSCAFRFGALNNSIVKYASFLNIVPQ